MSQGGRRLYINFRDLSARELGSIYERLLEFEPVPDEAAHSLKVRPNPFARKGSGSYYTPDELVELIVQRAIAPLADERAAAFSERAAELGHDRRPIAERLSDLARYDLAEAMVSLRICDPAMGSGHFLAAAVDFLADAVLEALAHAEEAVSWAKGHRYELPLGTRIEAIRERLRAQAREHGWRVDEAQLDDRQIIRRIILKRCVYGVDKNPMAVELAKVSSAATFTAGAPLSFLDHHLVCGDSLFGEWVGPVHRELAAKANLLINRHVQQALTATDGMARIERAADADIAEARESADTHQAMRAATAPLYRFLDFWQALRWLRLGRSEAAALDALLNGMFGPPVPIVAGLAEAVAPPEPSIEEGEANLFGEQPANLLRQGSLFHAAEANRENYVRALDLIERSQALAAEQHFLHWQVAFPGVWSNWTSVPSPGGFDVVIGNPPWDRIKLQEVEWFAARRPEIAHATTAAERKAAVEQLMASGDPLAVDYERAKKAAEMASRVARSSGQYPFLSRGDINLYALFIERAHRLIKPVGIVGMLVPWDCGRHDDKSLLPHDRHRRGRRRESPARTSGFREPSTRWRPFSRRGWPLQILRLCRRRATTARSGRRVRLLSARDG